MRVLRHAAPFLMLALALEGGAVPTTTVSDVATPRGTLRIAHYRPDLPLANLFVMSGGDGVLRLQPNGSGTTDNFTFNPLVRIRQQLLDAGYSLILIDAPSDMQAGAGIPFAHRVSAGHAAELLAVVQFVQQRDNLPAWLMGFSAGGPSVANAGLGRWGRALPGAYNFSIPSRDARGEAPWLPRTKPLPRPEPTSRTSSS